MYINKYSPYYYTTIITDTKQDGSLLSSCLHQILSRSDHPNVTAEIKTHQTRQGFSNLLLCTFLWSLANCNLSFLYLFDRNGTRADLLLLQLNCIKVRRPVRSETLFCYTPIANSGYLNYCCFSISLDQSIHSTSTSLHNFRS